MKLADKIRKEIDLLVTMVVAGVVVLVATMIYYLASQVSGT